jgi:DNA-directed RNA polymerase sigma subunit (sigma70/sigma32)
MKVQVNERGQRIGQGHRRAVLTDAEVERLLEDRGPEDAPRRSYAQLAKKYRVSKSSVRDIVHRSAPRPARNDCRAP